MALTAFEVRVTHLETCPTLDHVRVRGGVQLAFSESRGGTQPSDVFETSGYRVLMPSKTAVTEAVVINTGGGMAGGDRVTFAISAGERAKALVTSQAAERIYRSTGPATETQITLDVAANATLLWMPQETILYSGARLARRLEASMTSSSRLLVSEIVVLGRRAMGETLGEGLFKDTWRIHRDGRLVYAEAVHLGGEIEALLARASVTGGRNVIATVVAALPDAADWLEPVRAALETHQTVDAGASCWNGLLGIRMIGARLEDVRRALLSTLLALRLAHVPRVWNT